MFGLLFGIETLAKFATVLGFQEYTLQIDHVVIVMRPYQSLARKTNMRVEAFQKDNPCVPNSAVTYTC